MSSESQGQAWKETFKEGSFAVKAMERKSSCIKELSLVTQISIYEERYLFVMFVWV
jgi:hypothetical protein